MISKSKGWSLVTPQNNILGTTQEPMCYLWQNNIQIPNRIKLWSNYMLFQEVDVSVLLPVLAFYSCNLENYIFKTRNTCLMFQSARKTDRKGGKRESVAKSCHVYSRKMFNRQAWNIIKLTRKLQLSSCLLQVGNEGEERQSVTLNVGGVGRTRAPGPGAAPPGSCQQTATSKARDKRVSVRRRRHPPDALEWSARVTWALVYDK